MSEHVLIVCGYGCTLTPELKRRLDKTVEFCNRERPDCIITSGGFTQRKTVPETSEAHLMEGYIFERLVYSPRSFSEDKSYTTPDNIRKCWKMLGEAGQLEQDTKITVDCEYSRRLGADYLVSHIFGRKPEFVTMSWEKNWLGKEKVLLAYNWALVRFPMLGRAMRKRRIQKARKS